MHETPTRRFLYESKAKGRLQPYLYLTAGGLCVALAIAGMVFSVTRPAGQRVGPVEQYALVTVPVLFALAAFSYAVVLFRTPRRIELSIEGILLESPVKRIQIPWDQIDRAETDKKLAFIPGTEVDILVLRDAHGAKLAVISSAIKDFVDLSTRVQRIIRKRTGHATVNAKSRRSKRAAAWFIAFATILLALSVSAGFDGWKEWTGQEQLAKEGVETDATVTKHYLYNGRGPWVEYTFRDAKGRTFERRALLELHEWQLLEGARPSPCVMCRAIPIIIAPPREKILCPSMIPSRWFSSAPCSAWSQFSFSSPACSAGRGLTSRSMRNNSVSGSNDLMRLPTVNSWMRPISSVWNRPNPHTASGRIQSNGSTALRDRSSEVSGSSQAKPAAGRNRKPE